MRSRGTAVAFTDDADELNIRLGSGGVILVHCLNVGHFGSARTAPCCPIVDECEISILQNVTGDGVAVKVNGVKIADVHADTGFASGICRFRFGGHEEREHAAKITASRTERSFFIYIYLHFLIFGVTAFLIRPYLDDIISYGSERFNAFETILRQFSQYTNFPVPP